MKSGGIERRHNRAVGNALVRSQELAGQEVVAFEDNRRFDEKPAWVSREEGTWGIWLNNKPFERRRQATPPGGIPMEYALVTRGTFVSFDWISPGPPNDCGVRDAFYVRPNTQSNFQRCAPRVRATNWRFNPGDCEIGKTRHLIGVQVRQHLFAEGGERGGGRGNEIANGHHRVVSALAGNKA